MILFPHFMNEKNDAPQRPPDPPYPPLYDLQNMKKGRQQAFPLDGGDVIT